MFTIQTLNGNNQFENGEDGENNLFVEEDNVRRNKKFPCLVLFHYGEH